MDAIAATGWRTDPGRPLRLTANALPQRTKRASHVAVQPDGPFVIVSGRSAPGDLEPAARATMESLRDDLKTVGLTFDDVAQVQELPRRHEPGRAVEADTSPSSSAARECLRKW